MISIWRHDFHRCIFISLCIVLFWFLFNAKRLLINTKAKCRLIWKEIGRHKRRIKITSSESREHVYNGKVRDIDVCFLRCLSLSSSFSSDWKLTQVKIFKRKKIELNGISHAFRRGMDLDCMCRFGCDQSVLLRRTWVIARPESLNPISVESFK